MTAQTYTRQAEFFFAILDSIEQEIAVLDGDGTILFVNDAWVKFGTANGVANVDWLKTNYLNVCAIADRVGEPEIHEIMLGIQSVMAGRCMSFAHEYPCHGQDERRWFMMTIARLNEYAGGLFVVTHTNITQRKLMEEKIEALSLHDALTGLSNRRHFEYFFESEWQRNQRDKTPISLAIFDIDHFKRLNDRYGHPVGDLCLTRVAMVIVDAARRAGDLAVRWGGEEFVLVMGNTSLEAAAEIAEQVRVAVEHLPTGEFGRCTVSAGVAGITMPGEGDAETLVRQADAALYQAKQRGRNRVLVAPIAQT